LPGNILFFSESSFKILKEEETKLWISDVIETHKMKVGDINFIFVNEEEIVSINRQYLNHNYATDIITFNYNNNLVINADVYICSEVVKINAVDFRTTSENEIHRVIIHGVLHLLGFNDSTDEEKVEMRKEENRALLLRAKDLEVNFCSW
jgi:probable rRNA maturation factor